MIKIEVTGASIAEVADKLLAIGANLRGNAIVEAGRAVKAALNPIMPELGVAFVPEAAKTAAAPEPHISETSAPTPGTSSSSAAEPEPSAPPAEATESPQATIPPSSDTTPAAAPEITAEALRDLVLRVVKVKGREAMVAVLDTFGAAKASDVPAAQVPELVAALEALL